MVKFLILLLLVIFLIQPVYAEEYVFEAGSNNASRNAQVIVNPQIRQYIYGNLGAGQDLVDYYLLNFTETTEQVMIQLLVPISPELQNFHPNLILSDPNSRQMLGSIPFGYPENLGGRVFEWQTLNLVTVEDQTVSEKFTSGTWFTKGMSQNQYLVGVYDPQAKGGRYTLKIGAVVAPESGMDFFKKIWAFIRIKLRLY